MSGGPGTGLAPGAPGDRGAVRLIDCTLREGEQTPGVWLTPAEKLEVLEALGRAGVVEVDGCMPAVSAEEREFLARALARDAPPAVAASVRARLEDVREATGLGCRALFLIVPCSALHRRARLGLDAAGLRERAATVVSEARARGARALVVAEDASRAEPGELRDLVGTVVEAGADELYLCDTVGVWTPGRAAAATRAARSWIPASMPLGVHCHDDLGMAVANTVAAVEAGADRPTVTVNGIGERAGNASLVETALACSELLGLDTGLDPVAFRALSELVERTSGIPRPVQQPLLGPTAFRHESGIHVHGVLQDPSTYEPVGPERLGERRHLVAGKHSGRELLRQRAEAAGLRADEPTLDRALALLKAERPAQRRRAFERFSRERDRYLETALGLEAVALDALLRRAAAPGTTAGSDPAGSSGGGSKPDRPPARGERPTPQADRPAGVETGPGRSGPSVP